MAKTEGGVDSFLGDRSRLEGTLTFNGTLTVLGKFKGKIKGGEAVVLAETSESDADVEATHVSVHGKVAGSITAEKIGLIRGLLAEHQDWGRTRLSEELCLRWNWRNAQGRIKDMAARTLLLKLERRGGSRGG